MAQAVAFALLGAMCFAPVPALELGANVDGVVDYSFTLALVDVVKQSRKWGSLRAPWDGNCSVGSDGWPAQADCGNVFVTLPAGLPSPTHGWPSAEGVWLVTFQGAADLVLDGMQGASVVNQSYSAATDTTTLSLVVPAPGPSSCNCIMLGFANASTVAGGPGLKALKILQPGYTLSQAGDFSAPLLTLLQRFSVLRFMDWARTNGNLIEDWANRTLPSSPSYAPDGQAVPWELIFALANLLGKDPWINVPAHASDDYVLQRATLAKQLLDPGLNLYLEWSNEVWNWSFEQSHYALQAAIASVAAGDPYHLNASGLEGDGNPGYWHMRYYVAVSKAHGDIFEGVFGPGSVGKSARVRPVYAWQCGGDHEVGLAYFLRFYGEPSTFFHSLACAPYMTIGDAAEDPALTVEAVLAGWRSYQQNISLAGPFGWGQENYVAGMASTALYYGLNMQAYESGPDTAQGLNSYPALWAKGNASADPRIEAIIVDYLTAWHAYGPAMGPQNYFTLGAGPLDDKYGIYSVLQDMGVQSTPKLSAIDTALATPVGVSPLIPTIPTILNASLFVGHKTPASPNGFNGWPGTL
jgi:hypothetical protein